MSAFMTSNSETEMWGNALLRFLNTDRCGFKTRALFNKLWPYSPWAPNYSHSRDDHLAWQVGRLCRLMLMMNRRAVWHRYTLGRKGASRHAAPSWEQTRIGKLKTSHQAELTEPQRFALAKYLNCTVYQCSEYSNDMPRLLVLLTEFERTLDSDVFCSLKAWDAAPWGNLDASLITKLGTERTPI